MARHDSTPGTHAQHPAAVVAGLFDSRPDGDVVVWALAARDGQGAGLEDDVDALDAGDLLDLLGDRETQ